MREAYLDKKRKMIGLIISEIEMRWKENKVGNFNVIPLKRIRSGILGPGVNIFDINLQLDPDRVVKGGKQIAYVEPYSNLLLLTNQGQNVEEFAVDWFDATNIGPALSSIMSLVMRCAVVAYNEWGAPIGGKVTSPRLIFTGREWPVIWGEAFKRLEGLRRNISLYHPSPQEELSLIKTMTRIYDLLMNSKEKDYFSIMRAMRFYQLSHWVAREDQSLAYALLVAAIDSLSSRGKLKRFRNIDPKGQITNALQEAGLDENIQNAVKSLIAQGVGLKQLFSNFIVDNLPNTFWHGDNSLSKEFDMLSEQHFSGQYLRDLAECMPEPERQELLKQAEEQEKHYKEMKNRRAENSQMPVFDKERREYMLNYLSAFFDRVLKNTYDSRSDLLHRGKGFPKKVLEGEFPPDELPVMAEEDFWEFWEKHHDHGKVSYLVNERTGIIIRTCPCGNKKVVRMMLEIGVFERIVHDSILNYLINTSSQKA